MIKIEFRTITFFSLEKDSWIFDSY